MDLEIRHLRLVAAVAEHGNLTRAGATLHLTQSALSHQLRDIEDRLGARLFHRASRKLTPTPAGERLLKSALAVLSELRVTEEAIRNGEDAARATLRLSTECYTCYHWLPSVLGSFRRVFPRVDVRLDTSATREPLRALIDGQLDVGIMSTPVRESQFVSRPLFTDEQVVIVAPDHPFASRPHVKLSDFRQERLITYVPREESHFVTRVLQPAGVLPREIEPVQLTEAIIEMVKAGLGVAVMARWAVEPHVQQKTVRAVSITSNGVYKQWCAVFGRHLNDAEYLREFLRLVVVHAAAKRGRAIVPFRGRRPSRVAG
jgi:LysR family transcriptional regulator for metE and metH